MPANPKHPSTRARRNRTATSTELLVLDADQLESVVIPDPPPCFEQFKRKDEDGVESWERRETAWHEMALQTWDEVWRSPMRTEFLEADFGGLRMLLSLEHNYWTKLERGGSVTEQAAELSRIRKNYGLAPMGRRSLQWTVAQTAAAVAAARRTNAGPARAGLPDVESTARELPSGDDHADLLGALE